jgi:hypothetical protein
MEAIEFKTKIKNGIIQVPKKYNLSKGKTVRVIIISEQKPNQADIIDKLLTNPIQIENFSPFTREEIYEKL